MASVTVLNPTPGASMLPILARGGLHGCTQLPCPSGDRVLAIPIITPIMHWLGSTASKVVGDVWQAAMTGLWSAALWLLRLAFSVIDQFTNPDLSGTGPMAAVLPTTLWIGAAVAGLMMLVQLAVAVVRRDGQSLGRVFLGIGQFGAVWLAYIGVGAGVVAACAGLGRGILSATAHASAFGSVNLSASWPRNVDDVVLATVLGILSLLLVMPAAFFFMVIMFVREAALILLIATAPISAAGLLADASKVWFWKTLRWFIACAIIYPTLALVVGIGVQLSHGVVSGQGDKTAAAAGMAVVGCVIFAIGACCPLVLFRLLAFVDPSSASGAALRQSWSDAGGLSGLVPGKEATNHTGSAAATQTAGDGRSGGETAAESQTRSRLSAAAGVFGRGLQIAVDAAHKSADIGSDVLGSTGVGHPGYSLTYADTRAARYGQPAHGPSAGGKDGGESGQSDDSSPDDGGTPPSGTDGPPDVTPPRPPDPGPGAGDSPRRPQGPAGGGTGAAGGAAGAGGGEAAAGAAAL